MRLLVYGDASPASGGWCYAETLRDMGHEVLRFPDDRTLEHYRSSLPRRFYRKLFRKIWESDRRRHLHLLQEEVRRFRPEIIIILKGLHLTATDVHLLRRAGHWVCNVNHDDFFSANRNNWSPIQRQAIPAYDFIFTTREVNVEEVRPFNPNVEFFPFACYPRIHKPEPIPSQECQLWNVDAVFVGTYESPRAKLLEQLVQTVPAKYAVHGAQWHRLKPGSALRQYLGLPDLRFERLARALGGAKLALGFLRKENRDDYTQRTFEIPACNGLLLAERTARHARYYREGIEAEFFDPGSPEELCQKVTDLLKASERRERIRQAGHEAVLRGRHTYRDRLERLLEVYESTRRKRLHPVSQ